MTAADERHLRRAIELAAAARAAGDMPYGSLLYDGPALFDEARVPIDGYYG
jgi:tRNA(Arg) A34 adenosine deaminase TadA